MPSLESIREAARRAQSQRVQQRLTARTPQNAHRRARAEQERAATKKWGHWGRELPPKHKERHLQIAYLDEMELQRLKLQDRRSNNNTRRLHRNTNHYRKFKNSNSTTPRTPRTPRTSRTPRKTKKNKVTNNNSSNNNH